jgi:hypothetical protein
MPELRNFDLNLLVAFYLLMQEQNVSRAADRMFVSQSGMSHILQRLRQQLDDPLLVKTLRQAPLRTRQSSRCGLAGAGANPNIYRCCFRICAPRGIAYESS